MYPGAHNPFLCPKGGGGKNKNKNRNFSNEECWRLWREMDVEVN